MAFGRIGKHRDNRIHRCRDHAAGYGLLLRWATTKCSFAGPSRPPQGRLSSHKVLARCAGPGMAHFPDTTCRPVAYETFAPYSFAVWGPTTSTLSSPAAFIRNTPIEEIVVPIADSVRPDTPRIGLSESSASPCGGAHSVHSISLCKLSIRLSARASEANILPTVRG